MILIPIQIIVEVDDDKTERDLHQDINIINPSIFYLGGGAARINNTRIQTNFKGTIQEVCVIPWVQVGGGGTIIFWQID